MAVSVWSVSDCVSTSVVGSGELWSLLVVGVWLCLVVFVTVWEAAEVLCCLLTVSVPLIREGLCADECGLVGTEMERGQDFDR